MTIIDLFAGPGGWDYAAHNLGLDPIGIEWDPWACATRSAVGLLTLRADVDYPPIHIRDVHGLIASPPCPAFSQSGNGQGRDEIDDLCEWMAGDDSSLLPLYTIGSQAARDLTQPMMWVDLFRPDWVVLEQVPPVLPFWETSARRMIDWGYSVWTGLLNAADYGVPQTRQRAFLIGSRSRQVNPPRPTHSKHPQRSLFGDHERPWVTMAQALGWDGELATGNDWRPDGTSQTVDTTRPAPTITGKSISQWILNQGQNQGRTNPVDSPAPTLTAGTRNWTFERPATTVQGDARIWPPGHKINQSDVDRLGQSKASELYSKRAGADAIRVEPWQAGVLQSFPPNYPWQGSKTQQAQQIGNAVPPLLAEQILGSVV